MTDTLPPIPSNEGTDAAGEVWPTAGPAKGLRIKVPVVIAALVVVGFAGVAAGATLKKPSPSSTVQSGAVGGTGNRAFGNRGTGANGATGANGGTDANGAVGANGAPGGRLGGGVFGTVSKIEGNTVTITQRDGTIATVVVPSGTTITKTVDGSLTDLKSGTSVVVRGTTADGKTTAESVTINPANGLGGAFPGGAGGNFPAGGFPNGAPPAGAPTNG